MDSSRDYIARLPSPPFQLKQDGSIRVTNRYPYQKLSSAQHFRVLELFPRRQKLPFELKFKAPRYPYLRGSLSAHTLADAPEYECLSYVWGTENSDRVLWLDREVIAISKNLDKALGRLRHETESCFLWIDLVCINQQDLDERKQQVQLMYRIFGQAKRVTAYLGEEADGSQNVPNFLRQIQAAAPIPESDTMDLWSEQDLETLRLPPYGDKAWTMLQRFVMRSWFVRVWIMQEALAARSLDFMCGEWFLPAAPVVQTLMVAHTHKFACFGKPSSPSDRTAESIARSLVQLALLVRLGLCSLGSDSPEWQRGEWTLLEVLEIARQSSSTDPRDKVYALLNLCSDATSALIQPDYNLDTSEVFTKVACALIRAGQGPRLLLNAGVLDQTSSLPSWVPDWSQNGPHCRSIVGMSFMFPEGDCHSTDPVSYNIRIGQQEIELVVPMVSIDSIAHTLPLCVNSSDSDCTIDLSSRFSLLTLSDENVETEIDYSTWPPLFQLLITVVWHIGNSPRYSAQQAVEITWKTLLCSHEGAPDGGYPEIFSDHIHSYISYTRFFFDPRCRAQYVHETILRLIKSGKAPRIAGLDNNDSISIEILEMAWPYYREYLMTTLRASAFEFELATRTSRLRFARTASGFVGMVPAAAQEGDIFTCIESVQAPVILRPVDAGKYKIVGCAYFHGFMPGEPRLRSLMEESQFKDVILV